MLGRASFGRVVARELGCPAAAPKRRPTCRLTFAEPAPRLRREVCSGPSEPHDACRKPDRRPPSGCSTGNRVGRPRAAGRDAPVRWAQDRRAPSEHADGGRRREVEPSDASPRSEPAGLLGSDGARAFHEVMSGAGHDCAQYKYARVGRDRRRVAKVIARDGDGISGGPSAAGRGRRRDRRALRAAGISSGLLGRSGSSRCARSQNYAGRDRTWQALVCASEDLSRVRRIG